MVFNLQLFYESFVRQGMGIEKHRGGLVHGQGAALNSVAVISERQHKFIRQVRPFEESVQNVRMRFSFP